MTPSTKKAPDPPFITVELVLGHLTYKGSEVSVLEGYWESHVACRMHRIFHPRRTQAPILTVSRFSNYTSRLTFPQPRFSGAHHPSRQIRKQKLYDLYGKSTHYESFEYSVIDDHLGLFLK
jgi:hypothetical protein